MKSEMIALGAGTMSRDHAPRFLMVPLYAWRGITVRQWVWTTIIALLLLVAGSADPADVGRVVGR